MAGPIKIVPIGGSAGRTWYEPDLADLMTGALIESGASITVTSAYAFSGNNVKAQCTSSSVDDGMREGYGARCTEAKTDELWASLGTTWDRIRDGDDIFEAWMIPRVHPASRGFVHVGLADDGAFTSAMNGGAGGYAGSTVAGELRTSVQDRALDTLGGTDATFGDTNFFVTIPMNPTYARVHSYSVDNTTHIPDNRSYIRAASGGAARRLIFSLGNNNNAGNTYIADFDVWFAVRDGQFDTGPT